MGLRKVPFVVGEYYHLFNRGVDKRDIVLDQKDSSRFVQGMAVFNFAEPIGSIFEHQFARSKTKKENSKNASLVTFAAFCLNPNHFHFLVSPDVDGGIERFMQRFGTAYTKYFNNRYKRNGSLFGGGL